MRVRLLVTMAVTGSTALLGACGGGAQAPEAATEVATVTVTASSPPTGTTPVTDSCDPSQFLADFTEPVVMFCDGGWARAGQAQTDHVLLFRHGEGRWYHHPHDSRSELTGYFCYDEAILRAEGAPEELVAQVLLCGPGE